MSDNRPCRKELLDWINVVSFAVDDVKLFLDTHPCDKEALEYFEEFKKQRVQATSIPCKDQQAKSEDRTDHHHTVRRAGRGAGRLHAVSLPEILYAVQRGYGNTDGYRQRSP